ncbi:MAG: cytochrome c biogenesis protein ResB [Pyrinomonadaceae bacterium]
MREISTLGSKANLPRPETVKPGWGVTALAASMRWLSSVRLGVFLLCLLGAACLIGMLIMQQNVDGFENYYAALTPAQRLVYGRLGFFNIYHVWYFNALLALLSLNIILASVDRFPKAWRYFSKPQHTVPLHWLRSQSGVFEFKTAGATNDYQAEAEQLLKESGWKKVKTTEKGGRTYVFAESGTWNRLGAYAVHVGLLTIFLGGFLTAQLGTTGNLPLAPGESSDLIQENVVELDQVHQVTKRLPFEVTFTDIEQKLIRRDGSLGVGNTIDWITHFRISDETGQHDGMVQMNRPFDYRGYRFFQASYIPTGRARHVTIDLTPAGGGDPQRLTIKRDGAAVLDDGTRVRFSEFRGNFRIGPEDPNEDTSDYPNPAAILQVTPPGGTVETAYAFGPQMANIPAAKKPTAGYTYSLVDFEKVADRHILSVQRDPGATVVYVGFVLLCITLLAVFLFSHQRVWVVFEAGQNGGKNVISGGHTNRNPNAFEERFNSFRDKLKEKFFADKENL